MNFRINRTLSAHLGKNQEAYHQQMTPKQANEVFSAESTQCMQCIWNAIRNRITPQFGLQARYVGPTMEYRPTPHFGPVPAEMDPIPPLVHISLGILMVVLASYQGLVARASIADSTVSSTFTFLQFVSGTQTMATSCFAVSVKQRAYNDGLILTTS